MVYSIITSHRLKIRVQGAAHLKDNIYIVTDWHTPFVMGLSNPRIYLPETLSEKEQLLILHHEQTHIKHLDHITRLISFLALTLHWFNPLVWIAFHISGKDMEMACDEAVIKSFGTQVKKEYTTSLLALATGKKYLAGAPLAFGVGDTKGRIKNILNYKSPSFWLKVFIVVLVGMISIGLLANPETPDSNLDAANDFFDKQPGSDLETYKTVSAQALWNARTPYVGDNSAVSNLLSLMILPENLSHDSIQLYTDENERGLAWILVEGESIGYDVAELKQTALLLLALIENLEDFYVTVRASSGEETELQYDLAWANQIVDGNVKLYSESPEKLEELIDIGITEFPVVQYSIVMLGQNGTEVAKIPVENRNLAEAIWMDYLIKSSAWEGKDITKLEECYRIRQTYPQVGETHDYYTYLLEDGTPVLQSGLDGRYSTIAPSLYEQLVDSFDN